MTNDALLELVEALRKPGGIGVPMLEEPSSEWWLVAGFTVAALGSLILLFGF